MDSDKRYSYKKRITINKGKVGFKKDDDYYTPINFIKRFLEPDYDPATTDYRAELLGVKHYDTIDTDGLKQDWTKYKKIWINPPFTKKKEFLQKAVETYNTTRADIYYLCPVEFLTTKTFHEIIGAAQGGIIYLPNGRIKFEKNDGMKNSPAFGSVVVKIGGGWSITTIEI